MSRFHDRVSHPLLGFELEFIWNEAGLLAVGPEAASAEDVSARRSVIEAFPGVEELIVAGKTTRPIRLAPLGSPFQRKIWARVAELPFGTTVSYLELARELGLGAGAARAVGTACGRNPWPLVVPCHRVLASDGSLGGFIWGLPAKRRLLDAERAPFRLTA